jgi:MFS family permease
MIAAGYSVTRAAQIQAAGTLLHVVGNPAFGWLSDRTGPRLGLCTAYLLYALCFVFLAMAHYPTMALAFVITNGLSQGAILLIIPMVAAESFGLRRYGSIIGALQIFQSIGAAIGPILMGLIFDVTKSYLLAPEIYTVLCLIVAFVPFGCMPMAEEPAASPAAEALA